VVTKYSIKRLGLVSASLTETVQIIQNYCLPSLLAKMAILPQVSGGLK
jgi:hypothetical protein